MFSTLRRKYDGCLVRVGDVRKIEPNAKEYLSKLARYVEIVRSGEEEVLKLMKLLFKLSF